VPASFQPLGSKGPTNQRPQRKQRRQQQPDDPEQRVQPVGLDEGDAGQGGPQAGEQIAQVLADGHAQVAVEGLEGDLNGVAGGRSGRRVGGEASQLGDGEGPADQAQELHQRGQQPDGGGQGQDGGVGVGEGGREQHGGGGEQDRAHGEPPPGEDEAAAPGGEPVQDPAGWLAQDVGVVKAAGEQGVEQVVSNRKDQQ
jgi:hypothetical protein